VDMGRPLVHVGFGHDGIEELALGAKVLGLHEDAIEEQFAVSFDLSPRLGMYTLRIFRFSHGYPPLWSHVSAAFESTVNKSGHNSNVVERVGKNRQLMGLVTINGARVAPSPGRSPAGLPLMKGRVAAGAD